MPSRLRALGRVDVQLALTVGTAAGLLLAAVLLAFAAFAVVESLEEKSAQLERRSEDIATLLTANTQPAGVLREFPYRVLDADGQVVAASDAWSGVAGGGVVDVSLRDAFAASSRDHLLRRQRLADGRVLEVALSLRHFAGERRELLRAMAWIAAASFGVTLAFGVVAARRALGPLRQATAAVRSVDARHLDARLPVRGAGDDVDDLAAAVNEVLARLEAAFARMDAFGADVAHELRTPVNRMLNLADVALLDEAAARDETLVAIRDGAEQMRGVIERLLLLARGSEGRLPLRRERVDVGERVARLVELYTPAAEADGRKLDCSVVACRADVDPALLDRAVANLLDNALRHAPPGGRIRVGVAPDARGLCVRVEDSGPGVPAAERERIFERFVQLDPARRSGDAGLGLAIARMIARLHGGDATVEASELGGAAFQLRIPSAPARDATGDERSWPLWSRTTAG